MENKAKIGFLILLIFYIILAENEMWGPVIITGDTPAEAILKLSNTPAAVSAESVLVKRYDSTVSSYPINNIKTTKIQWDSVTSKPTAYNPVLHQHDSIYYREAEVNNLLSSKSDTSHTHPQSKINGLVDTITNHRNALDDKASLDHTHTSLLVPDTREVATTTSDYPRALKVNFKRNAIIGVPGGGTYSTVLGVFGWGDSSGGVAHELAFSSSGIYSRRGTPGNDWEPFRRILTTADNPSAIGAASATHTHAIADVTDLQTVLDGKQSTIPVGTTGQFYAWDKTMKAVDWTYVANKPSTFTPSAHVHAIADVTSLQTALDDKASLNHTHTSLLVPDTRNVATTTSDYNRELKVNFKRNSTIGLSGGGTYSTVLGVFGWNDPSGGAAHELAFGSNGIYSRFGIPGNDWGSFRRILTTADNPSAIGAAPATHNHGTGTTNYIPIFTNGATGAIGNSQLSQNTDGVIASKGITANDFLQSMGPLYTRSHTYLLNKTGDVWLNLITRNVSGSEAVADLSNVGSISMISPSTNDTMELYVDSSRSAAGINAQTGLLEIKNSSTATNGDILIQSVASDINISSLGESGEISLDAKRVKISRRNLKSQTFTYTVSGSYIIDLNNYYDVNLFIINSTADWVSIGFKNATVGDEIHVNIKGYGAVMYQRDPNSENAWYEWPGDAIKLDEFFYKLICTGTDNYYEQTINTWIIGT